MKSGYKKLGPYIQEVSVKNNDLSVELLLGVSITKEFIPSIANTVGTDMSKYKIVRKNQFAYGPVTSRNGDKISVALLSENESIISTSYTVFEIIDTNQLLPEYLMMWFRRPEFDRYARYMSHGSVRELFSWEEMCEVELPIPHIDKQREIVKEYNTIARRISLNEELNRKLEETAQAVYRQWFVDFEFPISKEYAEEIGRPELEGKPYKSNSGELVWNEELEKEIPKGWKFIPIQYLIDEEIIFQNQDGNHGEIHPKLSDFVSSGVPFIMASDIENGILRFLNCKYITKEQSDKLRIGFSKSGDVLLTHKATMGRVAIVPDGIELIVLTPQVTYYRVKNHQLITKEFLYSLFNSTVFQNILIGDSTQSTRNYIGITNQRNIKIILPDSKTIKKFSNILRPIYKQKMEKTSEVDMFKNLQNLLLSKMTKVDS